MNKILTLIGCLLTSLLVFLTVGLPSIFAIGCALGCIHGILWCRILTGVWIWEEEIDK
jgi:hypothetical protein